MTTGGEGRWSRFGSRLATLPLRFPKAAVALLATAVALAGGSIRDLPSNFGIEGLLPQSDPEVKRYEELAREHGRDDNSVYVFLTRDDLFTPEGLYGLLALTRELADSPLVEEAVSLATAPIALGDTPGGRLDVVPVDPRRLEGTDWAALRRRIVGERAFRRLVSADGRTALIAVRVRDQYYGDRYRREIIGHVGEVLEIFQKPGLEFLVTGNAPTRDRYIEFIRRDSQLFMPLSSLLLAGTLFVVFRRLAWVVLPLLALAASLVFTVAFMRAAGRPVNLLTSAIPVLVVIVGLSDAVHLLSRYEEELSSGLARGAALERAVVTTARACLLSTITTAVGFFVLPTTGIPMLADFGVVVGTGVLIAYGVTLALIPAVAALLPAPAGHPPDHESTALGRLGSWAAARPVWVVGGVALLLGGVGLAGIPRVRVESRILDDLPPDHPLQRTRAAVEARMGGNFPMTFVVHPAAGDAARDGAALDPALLKGVARFQEALGRPALSGVLSSTASAADYIRLAWQASGSPGDLPERPEDVQRMADRLGEAALRRLFDPRRRELLVDVRVFDRGTAATFRFLEQARGIFDATIGARGRLEVQGFSYLAHKVHRDIVWNSLTSFTLDFAIVSALVLVLFRSLGMAVLAIVPNLVPLVGTVAFMGLAGIDFRISSSIVFAIVYGIAIDDTVHFLARYEEEVVAAGIPRAALVRTMATTGRAMVLMAFVLAAGFAILTLSQFQPNRVLGLLMAVTVGGGLVGDLVLLPALLALRGAPRS